jgi:hypothetical protein
MQLSLFARLEDLVRPGARERRSRKPQAGGWQIIDHACRHCMGRIVAGPGPDGGEMVRCTECGAEEHGAHDALCYCGVELPGVGRAFECFRNPKQSLSVPQQVLVRERAVEGA